jgi:hypothetical protein
MADRTSVKTRRIASGVYATLNGEFQTARDGKVWKLRRSADGEPVGKQEGYRTSDEALSAIVTEGLAELAALNTAPAKPKAAKPEAKVEREESDRRSGATSEAPKAQPKGGRPHVKRGARKVA